MKIYQVALVAGERSPFLPADELHPDSPAKDKEEPKKRYRRKRQRLDRQRLRHRRSEAR